MKLLIIDLGVVWGGQEIYSSLLMSGLRQLGHHVVSVNSQPKLNTFADSSITVSASFTNFYSLHKQIVALVKLEGIDIIHFNGNRAMYLAALGGWGVPAIATKHLPYRVAGTLTFKHALARYFAAALFSRLNAIICVAQATYLDLPTKLQKLALVIVNGVKDPGASLGSRQEVPPTLKICYVARLAEHKGILQLITAVRQVAAEGCAIELQIAGSGPLQPTIEFAVAQDNKTFIYHGFVEDPSSIYANADICCLPSDHEGMPLNILEAMAHGVPVLATNIPGVNEVVSLHNGWLMTNNDAATIADYLRSILREPTAILAKSKVARRDYEADFSVDIMVDRTLNIYLNCLKEPAIA